MDRARMLEKLEEKKIRLEAYKKRELWMLSPAGVQSYGIGSRNVARYNIDLSQIRAAIKELEDDIDELEDALEGKRPRMAYGVIPRDI